MRLKRVGFNALAYVVAFFVNAIVALIVSPILLQGLGVVSYGVFRTLQKIFDIVSVADGRSSQALKMIIARLLNEDDQKKKEALGASVLITACFLPLSLSIVAVVYFFLPNIVGSVGGDEVLAINTLYVLMSLGFLISPILSLPDAVLMGVNQAYKSVAVQVVGILITNILFYLVVKFSYGLVGIGWTQLIVLTINIFVLWLVANKSIPWYSFKIPSKSVFKYQGSKTLYITVWMLVEKILLSSEMVLVGIICGPVAASAYSFMMYIPQMIMALLLIIGASVSPSLATIVASENKDESKIIIAILREIVLIFGVIFASMYILFNRSFVSVWVGNDFALDQVACVIIGFSVIQLSHIRTEAQLQDVVLSAKNRVVFGLIGALCGVLFSVVLSRFFDDKLISILIGGVVGRVLLNIIYPLNTNYLMGIDKVDFKGTGRALLFLLCVIFFSFYIPILDAISLIIIGLIVFVLLTIFCARYMFSRATQGYIEGKTKFRFFR